MAELISQEIINSVVDFAKFVAISAGATYLLESAILKTRGKVLDNPEVSRGILDRSGYISLEPFKVSGTTIQAIGVTHLPEVFIEHEDNLRDKIAKSHYVVLEYFRQDSMERAIPGVGNDSLLRKGQSYQERTGAFFAGVGQICAEEGKDIIVINPQTRVSYYVDSNFRWGLPVAMFFEALNNTPVSTDNLKEALIAASVATWVSMTPLLKKLRSEAENSHFFPPSGIPNSEQAKIWGWNLADYRDIETSIGLKKLVLLCGSEIAEEKSILLVQGREHNGVAEYAKRPLLANIKRYLYPHFILTGNSILRRYNYDHGKGEWDNKQEVYF